MSQIKVDCPDPCAKKPDNNCNLAEIEGQSASSIKLDVYIKLLTTKLIKDVCKCKDVIDLNDYPDDPEDPLSKKLSSLKLVITKKADPENPDSKCPIIKGKVRDPITGQPTNTQGSVNVNPGAGIIVDIGKDIKGHIEALRQVEGYDPCCLKDASTLACKIIDLTLSTSECHIPKTLKTDYYASKWDRFNDVKYDILTGYEEENGKYVADTLTFKDITAVQIYINRDAINLALNPNDSATWALFPDGSDPLKPKHPSRTIAEGIRDLNLMDSTIVFDGESQNGRNYYLKALASYNELIANLAIVHRYLAQKALDPKLKNCYDFNGLLQSGKEHKDNREIAEATVAINFIKNPCTYAKQINNSSWDANLCKWIECLGDKEKDDEGRYKISDLTVKLVKGDNTAYDECYENIPISATLSSFGNQQAGVNYTLNIEIGDGASCAEGGGCKDRYYAQIKQKLEYDFSSANCSEVNDDFLDLDCDDFSSDAAFQDASIIDISEFDEAESIIRVDPQTKYAYKAYRCKKCTDPEIIEEMNNLRKDLSGVCCKPGEFEVINAVKSGGAPGTSPPIPAGSKDSVLKKYAIYDNNTTSTKCCEYKGYFHKKQFAGRAYVTNTSSPSTVSESSIKSECLPPAVCCLPPINDTIGSCYFKNYDKPGKSTASARIDFNLEFETPVYNVKPNDCNDGLQPEQLYTCNIIYSLFKKIDSSQTRSVSFELYDIDKLLSLLPNMCKKAVGANQPVQKLITLDDPFRQNDIPSILSILQAMELLTYKSTALRTATIQYREQGSDQPITITVQDFVNNVLIPSTPESLKKIFIEPQHCNTLTSAIKFKRTFTKQEQEQDEKLKGCDETIASGKKSNFGNDTTIWLWMRSKSTKSCSLNKIGDLPIGKIISTSLCLSNTYTVNSYRAATTNAQAAPDGVKNTIKFGIKEALQEAFTFSPGECKYDTGTGTNDQFFKSACMDEDCCKQFCSDTLGLKYVSSTKSSGSFPGFPSSSENLWNENNSIVPSSNNVPYIEYTTDIKNQLINDLTDYIYNNNKFTLKLNDQDISKTSIEEFSDLVRANHIPCRYVLDYEVVFGANEDELKTKCRDLANENFYNKCSCVDSSLNDAEGIVAECEKEYSIKDARYILVKGTPGSIKVVTEKQKIVPNIGILIQQFTSGANNGKFLDAQYFIEALTDLPEDGIEVTYTNSDRLAQVKKTVTKKQLKDGRIILEELKNITVLPFGGIKATLKYNSKGTLTVGECPDSDGCKEIDPEPVSGNETSYVPAAHLCVAQSSAFRSFYNVRVMDPMSDQHPGYGGILRPDATECIDGVCDDATHPVISEPEEDAETGEVEPESDDPVVPETTNIKPECLDEYNKAVELVKKLKSQIELKLLRFQVAAAQYRATDFSDDTKLRELKIILIENYFGRETKTISDGTSSGFVISQNSPLPESELTVSKSCQTLMDQLDDAGANLSEIKERCKQE